MKHLKHFVAFALALCMVLGLMPNLALAVDPEEPNPCEVDGHIITEPVVENEVDPGCTTDGSLQAVFYCVVCGEELFRETVAIPALGHDFVEVEEIENPDAACVGLQKSCVSICTICGEAKVEYVTPCPQQSFPDGRSVSHWAHSYIDYVVSQGLMSGDAKGTFRPTDSMTRAELVTVLWRMSGSPETAFAATFKDVKQTSWFAEAVIWAANSGIVNGMGNGNFAPNDKVTRDQIALIFLRYTLFSGYQTPESANISGFKDANKVESWAKAAMEWAVGSGLIGGNSDGTLAPLASATREQLATILTRYSQGREGKTALVNEATCAHSWRILSQTKATCTAGGSLSQVCNLCGKNESRTQNKLGHNLDSDSIAPTCTTEGYTMNRCTRCSYSSKTNIRPALGHDFFEGHCTQYGCGAKDPQFEKNLYAGMIGTWSCSAALITDSYGQMMTYQDLSPKATLTINKDYTAVLKVAGSTYKITGLTFHEREYYTGGLFNGTCNGKFVQLIVNTSSGEIRSIEIQENFSLVTNLRPPAPFNTYNFGRRFTFVK